MLLKVWANCIPHLRTVLLGNNRQQQEKTGKAILWNKNGTVWTGLRSKENGMQS